MKNCSFQVYPTLLFFFSLLFTTLCFMFTFFCQYFFFMKRVFSLCDQLTASDIPAVPLSGSVLKRLNDWHQMVFSRQMEKCRPLLHDKVQFFSPVLHQPKNGPDETLEILTNVEQVFDTFIYTRETIGKRVWLLEFVGSVVVEEDGQKKTLNLKGLDILDWDRDCDEPEAQIIKFEVVVRPLQALQALSQLMIARLMGDAK